MKRYRGNECRNPTERQIATRASVQRGSVLMVGALLLGAAGAKAQQAQPDARQWRRWRNLFQRQRSDNCRRSADASATRCGGVRGAADAAPAGGAFAGDHIAHKIKRVSLADPTIAEAIVVSPYQVLVNGKAPGGVSLLLWDEADQSQAFEVRWTLTSWG